MGIAHIHLGCGTGVERRCCRLEECTLRASMLELLAECCDGGAGGLEALSTTARS
jgi:hypothetical protein